MNLILCKRYQQRVAVEYNYEAEKNEQEINKQTKNLVSLLEFCITVTKSHRNYVN